MKWKKKWREKFSKVQKALENEKKYLWIHILVYLIFDLNLSYFHPYKI